MSSVILEALEIMYIVTDHEFHIIRNLIVINPCQSTLYTFFVLIMVSVFLSLIPSPQNLRFFHSSIHPSTILGKTLSRLISYDPPPQHFSFIPHSPHQPFTPSIDSYSFDPSPAKPFSKLPLMSHHPDVLPSSLD